MISGFERDDDSVFHIERHEFTPDEVEEVFAGDHKVRRTRQKRYIALGETLDGRLAFVVFRLRIPAFARKFGESDYGQGHGRK